MLSEIQIQAEIFEWMWNFQPHTRYNFFHVPNGGKRSVVEAMQLKAAGVVAGIPDMILILPNSQTVMFELKDDTGKLSPAQIKVHEQLNCPVYVVRSLEEFKRIYYSIPDTWAKPDGNSSTTRY